MTMRIRDLMVDGIYRHDPSSGQRWIILRKEPCIGGFEIEYTTIDNNGVWHGQTTIERADPGKTWPVVLDMYLIPEDL